MSTLNDTPSGERTHIAFFGCRNAGKSSLVNAFTSQELSIVSETKGTTTDPVRKSMELLPLGPVVIIDTPGIDDEGSLGAKRIERAERVLNETDIAILVADASIGLSGADRELLEIFKKREIPFIIAYNKEDLIREKASGMSGSDETNGTSPDSGSSQTGLRKLLGDGSAGSGNPVAVDEKNDTNVIFVSALHGTHIEELKELTARLLKDLPEENELIGDLVSEGDRIVLVIPIDKAAPKGRLILPQQQVIRDALDHGAIPLMCRDSELTQTLNALKEPPRVVITDSQAFGRVSALVPESIPLTSFSILMARYKGNLLPSVAGAAKIRTLQSGDRVLISEGCTHHRQCGDIGSVKLPNLLRRFTGTEPGIDLSSGKEFPSDLSAYRLVIHCGACMLNPAEAQSRYRIAKEQRVPVTNYGTAIAYMDGILRRSLSLFPEALALLQ